MNGSERPPLNFSASERNLRIISSQEGRTVIAVLLSDLSWNEAKLVAMVSCRRKIIVIMDLILSKSCASHIKRSSRMLDATE